MIPNNQLIVPAEVIFSIVDFATTMLFELPLTLFPKQAWSRHWVNGFLVDTDQSTKFQMNMFQLTTPSLLTRQ